MSRWEPHAPERLVAAAVDLFLERGYDRVTITEIAQRAGLTKRTFFRHFADKREILFGGQDAHRQVFANAIASAPPSAKPLEAISAALAAFAAELGEERRDVLAKRQVIIDGKTDLQERELLKRAALTAAMAQSLGRRGVSEPIAGLAAEIGALAMNAAYRDWLQPDNPHTLTELSHQALRRLGAAAATLR
ncbi:TetR/AcrR family transcriptional regulator [Mycobacterium sp. WMMD1722]|uniref:TetR/AcrR family transcriptional regulator n=1 Tax=Mycobacterium sp. WMMD1722 TaxID=3404117 RepID=UPI003BF46B61